MLTGGVLGATVVEFVCTLLEERELTDDRVGLILEVVQRSLSAGSDITRYI